MGSIFGEYHTQLAWLESLITDPAGERYLRKKSPEQKLRMFEKKIDRATRFLDFLGKPQETYPSLHVAGSGGKGSVTVMIGNILQRAGFKTGVHISPYLQVPNEKWLLKGKMISPSVFTAALANLRPSYEAFAGTNPDLRPTYGEVQVALTHQIFAHEDLNFGVIETGMGGRYDCTNILNPEIAIITNVDFDHQESLGPSLREIAFHKAGIIKPETPIITGVKQGEVLAVISKEAQEKQAPLFQLGKDFRYQLEQIDTKGSVITIETPDHHFVNLRLSLPGRFQVENAALAVYACNLLANKQGFELTSEILNQALSHLYFPGRLEKVQDNPTVILDGAHNPQKTRALATSMRELYPNRQYSLLIGMLASKDAASSVAPLLPQAARVITSQPQVVGKPSISPKQMAKIIRTLGFNLEIVSHDTAEEAVSSLLNKAGENELILITGSLYLLGEARNFWHPKEEILFKAEFGE